MARTAVPLTSLKRPPTKTECPSEPAASDSTSPLSVARTQCRHHAVGVESEQVASVVTDLGACFPRLAEAPTDNDHVPHLGQGPHLPIQNMGGPGHGTGGNNTAWATPAAAARSTGRTAGARTTARSPTTARRMTTTSGTLVSHPPLSGGSTTPNSRCKSSAHPNPSGSFRLRDLTPNCSGRKIRPKWSNGYDGWGQSGETSETDC
jgi:hypothetical protein